MMRHVLAFVSSGVLSLTLAGCDSVPQPPPKNPDAVKVDLFVMSQCPFGVQAVNGIKPALDKLGADVDFNLEFIGDATPTGELKSMHGDNEVKGDIVQLCAAKYAPVGYLDMILCQNKNFKEVASNWESCATEAKLPVDKIKTCFEGQEGKDLLKASFAKAKEKGAQGSPTFMINGKPFNSNRRGANDLARAICAEHKNAANIAACQNIPAPPKVNITVINDKRCTDCRDHTPMLKDMFPSPNVKVLDYSEPEAKQLYTDAGGGAVPMILFDNSINADEEGLKMLRRYLRPAGSTYQQLQLGSTFRPDCAEEKGCELAQCKDTIACRKEAPKKLELFIMSQCPYGVQALNAMGEVLKNFENKIDFSVHYIADGTASGGFRSLHGPAEVDENIRELCAQKYYAKGFKFMDYVNCRNKNIRDTNWQACTGANGIDTKVIEKCATGDEGKKLHEEDIAIARGLAISGSPSWIANGKYRFSALDAESIKKNLCDHNTGLKGCENKLSGPAAGGAPQGGGCGN